MKKVINIQNLIENYLTSNKGKDIISQKKGYRTFSIKGQELNEKIKKKNHKPEERFQAGQKDDLKALLGKRGDI